MKKACSGSLSVHHLARQQDKARIRHNLGAEAMLTVIPSQTKVLFIDKVIDFLE